MSAEKLEIARRLVRPDDEERLFMLAGKEKGDAVRRRVEI